MGGIDEDFEELKYAAPTLANPFLGQLYAQDREMNGTQSIPKLGQGFSRLEEVEENDEENYYEQVLRPNASDFSDLVHIGAY